MTVYGRPYQHQRVVICVFNRLLHYAKLAVNGQPIIVWEELSLERDDHRKPFLQVIAGAFEVQHCSLCWYSKLFITVVLN